MAGPNGLTYLTYLIQLLQSNSHILTWEGGMGFGAAPGAGGGFGSLAPTFGFGGESFSFVVCLSFSKVVVLA